MNYTKNESAVYELEQLVEDLRQTLIERLNPRAVILAGSFGRGEVTVEMNGESLEFTSDCEVVIVDDRLPLKNTIVSEIEAGFRNKYGLDLDISGVKNTLQFHLGYFGPTINNYDLKYGSETIYGPDLTDEIPEFTPKEVPIWEGIREMFNRMIEVCRVYKNDPTKKKLFYWLDKLVFACQDALLLQFDQYDPSYEVRASLLEDIELQNEGISVRIEDLVDLCREALDRKLYGYTGIRNSSKSYWNQVQKVCNSVFKFTLIQELEIHADDYSNFPKQYLTKDLTDYIRMPGRNRSIQNLWSLAKFVGVYHELPTPSLIRKCRSQLAHEIYAVIPLLFFSQEYESLRSGAHLDVVSERVGEMCEVDFPDQSTNDKWRYLVDRVVYLWKRLCW
ncbi:hypothetical protein [Haloferax sp. YSMS24]|uniref:hypothetical protein n=1 Tax=Haloferax sp. YSMS24 TaxID=3388425 RepID=UPI00398CE22C